MQSDENNQALQNIPSYAQEQINNVLNHEKLAAEVEKDLNTNPKYKSFFDQYYPSSIKNFIQHYKIKKASWLTWGSLYQSIEQKKILKYSAIANERIWEIQQKKTFQSPVPVARRSCTASRYSNLARLFVLGTIHP